MVLVVSISKTTIKKSLLAKDMADLTKNQKRDLKVFFVEKGDPGFNPKRNHELIEKSIQKYEAKRKQKLHEFDDLYAERADAVVTYLKGIDRGRVNSNLNGFFTPTQIKTLRGDDIRDKLHEGITFIKNRRALQGR